ncbi:hypothetical protein DPMN_062252 [Dreissena polymorpha]|uniref:Uncharacterized protein n=1 Tax=Dreissena polymorpha TaxID=45954 RepID=A0A9D4HJ58_DREPO|nr:hypothetical protein DPMN_062252 [Dreissena polymorpha]
MSSGAQYIWHTHSYSGNIVGNISSGDQYMCKPTHTAVTLQESFIAVINTSYCPSHQVVSLEEPLVAVINLSDFHTHTVVTLQ